MQDSNPTSTIDRLRAALPSNNTTVQQVGNVTVVILHTTTIVSVAPDRIVLNHGGHKSRTTVSRINAALDALGFAVSVRVRKGRMIASVGGAEVEFVGDRLVLRRVALSETFVTDGQVAKQLAAARTSEN